MSARITDPEQLKELLGIPFTPEQMACITAPPAPQVIVAGAGSGKTTVMAARVVWLAGTGQVAPEQVLGLTFTNKAAGELAERVRKALIRAGVTDPDVIDPDNPPGEPRISTYHAFAGQLLAEHGLRIGLEPTARLLADATRYQLAARVLREAPGPYPALTKSFPSLVSDLLALDGELAEHLVKPARLATYDTELLSTLASVKLSNADLRKVPEAAAARLELLELTTRYREAKRSRDLLDFGDQIALSAELALTSEEAGRILRDEFRVVLLDEYQDTSVAQRLLLSGLFGGGTGHAVTAVGDPCQAIYGWRGASVANLDDFPAHFPYADGSPAARFSLSENRRSGGRLLDLANGLAVPLRAMHEGVEALRPAPGAERDGIVRCALLPTHAEEIAWLADSIAHLVRTGKEPGEIAVLCRTAGDFAEIQGALVARDVPVEVVGLSGLLHLPEVADLVAVCEVLQDPGANASLVRILTGPRWRIGPRDLALLGRRARLLVHRARGADADADPDGRLAEAVEGVDPAEVISLADALDTFLESGGGTDDGLPFSADARVRFARLAAELRDLRRSLADPLMDVLHRVLATTGLEVELSASPHALAARRRETLSNFLDTAAGFAALDGEANLLAFLAFLRTAAQYEKGLDNALPGGENTVKVLTAHKSKGLEWDVVAAPGLVTGHFPSEQSRDSWTSQAKVLPHALRGDAKTLPDVADWDAKGIKAFKDEMKAHQHTEELRLGYVTFTRPRSLLLGSGHWWGPTQKKPRGPSAFLRALYDHCAAGFGEIEAWADEPAEGEENPSLRESATDRAWPLPLDPTSMARRRRAAETVMAHLKALATVPAEAAAGTEGDFDADPEAWDTLLTERPAPAPGRAPATGTTGAEADAATHAEGDVAFYDDGPDAEHWNTLLTERPVTTPGGAAVEGGAEPGTAAAAAVEFGAEADAGTGAGGCVSADVFRDDDSDAADWDTLLTERPAATPGPGSAEGETGTGVGPETEPRAATRAEADADGATRHPRVVPAARTHSELDAHSHAHAELPRAREHDPSMSAFAHDTVPARRHPADREDPADPATEPAGPRDPAPRFREGAGQGTTSLTPEEARSVASWDRDLDALAGELRRARATTRDVPVPPSLTASQLLRLAADPDGFAHELARPMPRPPQPAARRGTRFHAWVESRFEELPLPMLGPDELPGGDETDADIADERDLAALKEAFERSPYARRTPYRVEAPFHLTLAGRVIRGRIDAVYRDESGAYEIVDWKTSRTNAADPLQLAVYRLAWAEQHDLPLDAVGAAFLYVRTGEIARPARLPGRGELERILLDEPGPAAG
ncbi:UvrD-helicase domain-containing protein [Streptomyces sp. ISL-100]|uniref:UvrD-helicase domain-containing protein n=1 Tax=Streptomyces sp. ISL-100 TaxID=2819173 RepID=UPI001BECFABD|nr:UvrD-helicase domain-containing protein [Streptomyces sp. ISL-100]MBT2400312.1 UvrD-helicase domain-containing protein [Streptomyces sp. ISL-100]